MSHSVTLTWTPPVGGAIPLTYDVQRAPVVGGVVGAFVSIDTPEITAATYVDNGPFVEGSSYAYQVCSVNSAGESVPCAEVTVIIPFSIPGAPTNLVAKTA